MLDRPRYYCNRFSGRPEGFGEDASFFFDRAGFGAARWEMLTPTQPSQVVASHQVARRVIWGLVGLGLVCCLVLLLQLRPRFPVQRMDAAVLPPKAAPVPSVQTAPVRTQVLLVPQSALRINRKGAYVAVIDPDNVVHLRKVEVGEQTRHEVEIRSGLDGTETIISHLPDTLQDGMNVARR